MKEELKFWLVWNEKGNHVAYKHWTESDAEKEAERLARSYPGNRFVVLESKTARSLVDVEVTNFRANGVS